MPGSSSWVPSAPQRVKGFDDDDDDDDDDDIGIYVKCLLLRTDLNQTWNVL